MNAETVHVIKGADVERDTLTLCGRALESLPRAEYAVPYAKHERATCAQCRAKVERIETMRAGLRKVTP